LVLPDSSLETFDLSYSLIETIKNTEEELIDKIVGLVFISEIKSELKKHGERLKIVIDLDNFTTVKYTK